MTEALQTVMALSIPFLLGIYVGVEIVRRRPETTNEKLGKLIRKHAEFVYDRRRFVGPGLQISSTIDLPLKHGRTMLIVVQEDA